MSPGSLVGGGDVLKTCPRTWKIAVANNFVVRNGPGGNATDVVGCYQWPQGKIDYCKLEAR